MGVNHRFRALSDPTRREILRLLRNRGMSAGDIAGHFDLAPSTMSGHFASLKAAGLIVAERHGTSIVYSLSTSVLDELIAELLALTDNGSTPPRSSG